MVGKCDSAAALYKYLDTRYMISCRTGEPAPCTCICAWHSENKSVLITTYIESKRPRAGADPGFRGEGGGRGGGGGGGGGGKSERGRI